MKDRNGCFMVNPKQLYRNIFGQDRLYRKYEIKFHIECVYVQCVHVVKATIYWDLRINPFFQLSGPNSYFPPKSKQNLEYTGIK